MDEIRLFIDWLLTLFKRFYDFFSQQHPIVQARVFLPLAVMVISLFILVVKALFKERGID